MNPHHSILAITTASLLALEAFTHAADPTKAISHDAAIANLQAGNKRFSANAVTKGKPVAARRKETAETQKPFAIVVGCADSRTAPELVFDHNIGDLFVVRTAGNLVNEHALGSIEYAVAHLGARLIVVLGHERCGAVKAALGSETAPGNVNSIVRDIQPAVKAAKAKEGDALTNTIHENVRQVAANIRASAKLGELASEVRIVTAVYDLDTGVVEWPKE